MHNNINESLLKFASNKKNESIESAHYISTTKLYWKRFFSKKSNIFALAFFSIVLLIFLIMLAFVKYSPTKPLSNIAFVRNLPIAANSIVIRSFEKGKELDFIREIANLENLDSSQIFQIFYDSALDSGGELTVTSDIVFLQYNPYDFLKALSKYTDLKLNISPLILGSNANGIDIYSRTLISMLYTFSVILIAIFINLFIGFSLGALYSLNSNKWYAKLIDSVANILNAIPEVIWIFVFSIFIGTNWWQILITLILCSWTQFYEISKHEINEFKSEEFILASESIGLNKTQIVYRHLFKLVLPSLIILIGSRLSTLILCLSSLAFLEFLSETNNLNIGTIFKEALSSLTINPFYIVTTTILIIGFCASLKLFYNALSATYNPQI